MNKTEKNEKLFSSGGVFVDIFIGFLIAACIAGVVYRCFIYDPNARQEAGESYMVYFEIENAYESYVDYLNSGNQVYDGATGLRIGALALHEDHVESSAVAMLKNDDAEQQSISVEGVFRSVPGVLEQGTLVIGGSYMLTPGQVSEIYTDTVSVEVRILQITEAVEE
jgi:hypothetical protein